MTDDDAWIRAERSHEREMAEIASRERERKRQAMTARITTITIGVTVVAVVAVVAFLLWRWVATVTENNTERDEACFASGGTRAPVGANGPILCLHLGGELQ